MTTPLGGSAVVGGSIPAALSEAISEFWLPAGVELLLIGGCDEGNDVCLKGIWGIGGAGDGCGAFATELSISAKALDDSNACRSGCCFWVGGSVIVGGGAETGAGAGAGAGATVAGRAEEESCAT